MVVLVAQVSLSRQPYQKQVAQIKVSLSRQHGSSRCHCLTGEIAADFLVPTKVRLRNSSFEVTMLSKA